MTNEEFRERVCFGLELSYRRMLREKALHNEDVIMSNDQNEIILIPAQQILESLPPMPEPPESLRGRTFHY